MSNEIKDGPTAPEGQKPTKAPVKKTAKPKAPAKPTRVKMRNTKAANGTVGDIAQPWGKDVPVWEKAGWVRV